MHKLEFRLISMILCLAFCSCGASVTEGSNQNVSPTAPQAVQTASNPQADTLQSAAVDPNKFAVIVAGVGGEDAYKKRFTSEAMRLYDALTRRLGFDEKHVFLLTEDAIGGPENGPRENYFRSTAEEVRNAFKTIKGDMKPGSLVLVTLIGHGSFDTQQAKFNLVGPDLAAKDYGALLGSLAPARIVFVNCASSSGEFVKPAAGENRIVITATRGGNEQNATIFAEQFIAALTDAAADADHNGRLSVIEVFNYATKLTADWYKQKDRLATEHAVIEDSGDGVGHEEATAGDGALARTTYLDSRHIEHAGADAEMTRLLGERQRLEEAIEKLKARKNEMRAEDYDAELERLLVELAKVNQAIKKK
ncbi:MAG TPA: hypothetical protein VJH03_22905 [Blastocatellia bacterium]|nr:hypothetical protein [Blastocatellia bacterium]